MKHLSLFENFNVDDNLLTILILIPAQLKLLHWQTFSFAQHEGFDKTYTETLESIDELAEAFMGKYSRNSVNSIELKNCKNIEDCKLVFQNLLKLTEASFSKHLEQTDPELINISQEILAKMHRMSYLLTMQK